MWQRRGMSVFFTECKETLQGFLYHQHPFNAISKSVTVVCVTHEAHISITSRISMSSSRPNLPDWEKEIRCPRLGGPVKFAYCRAENQGRPCARSLTCWSFSFAVEEFFHKNMSVEQFEECFNTETKPKVVALIELIEKARKTLEEKSSRE